MTESGGKEYRYHLAVYVTDRKVLLGESGGPSEQLDAHRDAIRQAFRTIR